MAESENIHRIHDLSLENSLAGAEGVSHFDDDLVALWTSSLGQQVEDLATQILGGEVDIFIENWELDLGEIDSADWEREYTSRLLKSIREELEMILQGRHPAVRAVLKPRAKIYGDTTLDVFLKTGGRPRVALFDPELAFRNLLHRTPEALRILVLDWMGNPSSRQRLLRYLPVELMREVFRRIAPDYLSALSGLEESGADSVDEVLKLAFEKWADTPSSIPEWKWEMASSLSEKAPSKEYAGLNKEGQRYFSTWRRVLEKVRSSKTGGAINDDWLTEHFRILLYYVGFSKEGPLSWSELIKPLVRNLALVGGGEGTPLDWLKSALEELAKGNEVGDWKEVGAVLDQIRASEPELKTTDEGIESLLSPEKHKYFLQWVELLERLAPLVRLLGASRQDWQILSRGSALVQILSEEGNASLEEQAFGGLVEELNTLIYGLGARQGTISPLVGEVLAQLEARDGAGRWRQWKNAVAIAGGDWETIVENDTIEGSGEGLGEDSEEVIKVKYRQVAYVGQFLNPHQKVLFGQWRQLLEKAILLIPELASIERGWLEASQKTMLGFLLSQQKGSFSLPDAFRGLIPELGLFWWNDPAQSRRVLSELRIVVAELMVKGGEEWAVWQENLEQYGESIPGEEPKGEGLIGIEEKAPMVGEYLKFFLQWERVLSLIEKEVGTEVYGGVDWRAISRKGAVERLRAVKEKGPVWKDILTELIGELDVLLFGGGFSLNSTLLKIGADPELNSGLESGINWEELWKDVHSDLAVEGAKNWTQVKEKYFSRIQAQRLEEWTILVEEALEREGIEITAGLSERLIGTQKVLGQLILTSKGDLLSGNEALGRFLSSEILNSDWIRALVNSDDLDEVEEGELGIALIQMVLKGIILEDSTEGPLKEQDNSLSLSEQEFGIESDFNKESELEQIYDEPPGNVEESVIDSGIVEESPRRLRRLFKAEKDLELWENWLKSYVDTRKGSGNELADLAELKGWGEESKKDGAIEAVAFSGSGEAGEEALSSEPSKRNHFLNTLKQYFANGELGLNLDLEQIKTHLVNKPRETDLIEILYHPEADQRIGQRLVFLVDTPQLIEIVARWQGWSPSWLDDFNDELVRVNMAFDRQLGSGRGFLTRFWTHLVTQLMGVPVGAIQPHLGNESALKKTAHELYITSERWWQFWTSLPELGLPIIKEMAERVFPRSTDPYLPENSTAELLEYLLVGKTVSKMATDLKTHFQAILSSFLAEGEVPIRELLQEIKANDPARRRLLALVSPSNARRLIQLSSTPMNPEVALDLANGLAIYQRGRKNLPIWSEMLAVVLSSKGDLKIDIQRWFERMFLSSDKEKALFTRGLSFWLPSAKGHFREEKAYQALVDLLGETIPAVAVAPEPIEKKTPQKSPEEEALNEAIRDLLFEAPNAGIALVLPYLGRFLEVAGVLENNEFVSVEARERAVFLLYCLCGGSPEPELDALVLNKVLCGIHPMLPLGITRIELTEDEENLIHSLLSAVIGHWEALGETTPETLQGYFLMREGTFWHSAEGWRIEVQSQTYDLLMQRLPWSISMTSLSWLDELIFVDWKAGLM